MFPASTAPLVDLRLSQKLEHAEGLASRRYIEAKRRVFPTSEATWCEIAGAYALYDTAQSPLTQSFGLGIHVAATDDDLEQIERFFVQRGAAVSHEISPLADPSLLGQLHHRKYYPIELTSVLYRSIDDGWLIESNPAIKVRSIEPDEQAAYSTMCAAAWQLPAEYAGFFDEMGKISAQNEYAKSFVVELNGKPIGGGSLWLSDDVALIAGDCTLPEARRQGGQLALLAARIEYAREHGYKLMMMCAQPGSSSQKNGQRAGMHIAYTRIKWSKAM